MEKVSLRSRNSKCKVPGVGRRVGASRSQAPWLAGWKLEAAGGKLRSLAGARPHKALSATAQSLDLV